MPWKECHVVDERLRFVARRPFTSRRGADRRIVAKHIASLILDQVASSPPPATRQTSCGPSPATKCIGRASRGNGSAIGPLGISRS